jgi:RNA polymerase sigma-70 factor (ECF subfamily)
MRTAPSSHVYDIRGTDRRLVRTAANGQPALAAYVRQGEGPYRAHSL